MQALSQLSYSPSQALHYIEEDSPCKAHVLKESEETTACSRRTLRAVVQAVPTLRITARGE